MNRQTMKSLNDLATNAMAALERGDTVRARRWLKTLQHDTSDAHLNQVEQLAASQSALFDLPSIEMLLAEAAGNVVEGTYTRGPVL